MISRAISSEFGWMVRPLTAVTIVSPLSLTIVVLSRCPYTHIHTVLLTVKIYESKSAHIDLSGEIRNANSPLKPKFTTSSRRENCRYIYVLVPLTSCYYEM